MAACRFFMMASGGQGHLDKPRGRIQTMAWVSRYCTAVVWVGGQQTRDDGMGWFCARAAPPFATWLRVGGVCTALRAGC
jgi:hypothetical protein